VRKPNTSFVVGCLCGLLLGVGGLTGAFIGGALLFKERLVNFKERTLMPPPLTSGLKAVYDWSVTGLDGQTLAMTETQNKAVFLHFWHSECVICQAETAAINRLYETLREAGVVFVCISTDSVDHLADTVAISGIRFPVYSLSGERPSVYQTPSIPSTFFIAPNGDIVFKHVGGAKWDDPATIEYLRSLAGTTRG